MSSGTGLGVKPNILERYGDSIQNVEFSSRIVGSTFHPHAQEVLLMLKKSNIPMGNVLLRFVPEPDNEYDSNAVAIYLTIKGAKNEYKVGYVPRVGSEVVFYVLNHPEEYSMFITSKSFYGGTDSKEFVGLYFDFRILMLSDREED